MQIVNLLYQRTNDGDLPWRMTAEDTFMATIGRNTVVISKDIVGQLRLDIYDTDGNKLETVGEEPALQARIKATYEIVRKRVLNVDASLEELLRTLRGT